MNALYSFMVESSGRVMILANEMVSEASSKGRNLNYVGASLSYEYDRLSHASIQVVQHNLSNEISRNLRKSVLNLGQLCLELIRAASSIQNLGQEDVLDSREDEINQCTENITEEGKTILGILNNLKAATLTSNQNAYKNAGDSIGNLLSSFKRIKRYSNSLEPEAGSDICQRSMLNIIREMQPTYNTLKMTVSNIVSSTEESIVASLEALLKCLTNLSEAVKNYVLASTIEEFQGILASMEEMFLFFINFLMVCEEIDGKTEEQHNKEILKMSCKDVVESIRSFMKEASNKINPRMLSNGRILTKSN